MTIPELRQTLMMELLSANAPDGLEAAIFALPDTRLVDRLPKPIADRIRKQLAIALRHERMIAVVKGLESNIQHFVKRMNELHLSRYDAVIGILSTNDSIGRYLSERVFGAEHPHPTCKAGDIAITMSLLSRPAVEYELDAIRHPLAKVLVVQQEITIIASINDAIGLFCVN